MNTQTQIKVLQAAKIVFRDYNELPAESQLHYGLCFAIKIALKKYVPNVIITNSDILDYIPLFTYQNAVKFGKARVLAVYGSTQCYTFWWATNSYQKRQDFLDWMILVLTVQKGLPIKTQIQVFKKVKREIIKRVILNHLLGKHYHYYLCTLTYAFSGIPILPGDTQKYFPLLTYINATGDTEFPENTVYMGPWWSKEDFLSRLRFLNKVIKQLKSIQNV